ncbi:MAG: hypothetical protein ACKVS6_16940 [Planctomycetota bacterium]
MRARQLFILAALLAAGAAVAAAVPKDSLFNNPAGVWVLGSMAFFVFIAAVFSLLPTKRKQ